MTQMIQVPYRHTTLLIHCCSDIGEQFLEDNYEYLKARYKIENGSLFLTDTFQTVEYKKCGNK